jgi:hypothetical protein
MPPVAQKLGDGGKSRASPPVPNWYAPAQKGFQVGCFVNFR